MREIKFRAWDKTLKQMMYLDRMSWGAFWDIVDQTYEAGRNNILLQYTGLKDKNGKEIFGGDIVKFGACGYRYEIKWDKDGAWLFYDGGYLYEQDTKEMEIIGNIYENEELLK